MKRNIESQQNYRKQISYLIQDCFIQLPDNYNFTSDKAFAYLNKCANIINKNYGEIVFILGTVFNIVSDDFFNWLKKFNNYINDNKITLLKLEHRFGYESVCLTDNSKMIFCHYVDNLNNLISELSGLCSKALAITKRNPTERNVFIVHGHNTKLRDMLKKSLIKCNYNPIVLSEMNDSGISLFDKFEKYANTCTKAIILMTSDDLITKNEEKYYQGRPNVLIEYGYFLSMMGKHDVVVLLEKGCKKPSDIDGVSYIEYVDKDKNIITKIIDSLNMY